MIAMASMNISLPDALRAFVESQVQDRGYGTSSEYVRDLIRRDQAREELRGLLIDGIDSGDGSTADSAHFQQLRDRIDGAGAA